MLMPKKVKFRKQQRGRMNGKAYRGSSVTFGEYDVVAIAEIPDSVSAAALSMAIGSSGAMSAYRTPAPRNEPVLNYAPGSPERAALKAALDAAQVYTPEQVQQVVELFLGGADRDDFRRGFDLVSVQRKLKDAGRFVFIDRVRGNPGFLVSIPSSLRYVREALARRPELAPLQRLLARHLPELG